MMEVRPLVASGRKTTNRIRDRAPHQAADSRRSQLNTIQEGGGAEAERGGTEGQVYLEVERPGTEVKPAEQSTKAEQGTRVKPTQQKTRAESAEQEPTRVEQTHQDTATAEQKP